MVDPITNFPLLSLVEEAGKDTCFLAVAGRTSLSSFSSFSSSSSLSESVELSDVLPSSSVWTAGRRSFFASPALMSPSPSRSESGADRFNSCCCCTTRLLACRISSRALTSTMSTDRSHTPRQYRGGASLTIGLPISSSSLMSRLLTCSMVSTASRAARGRRGGMALSGWAKEDPNLSHIRAVTQNRDKARAEASGTPKPVSSSCRHTHSPPLASSISLVLPL
mmetsp:Transcript_30862/g.60244  ORF Transcript_30862/g.60244 Transcript_30862/m.60244 type:complete len:223 (+) Transcript_30862:994-1662(+)